MSRTSDGLFESPRALLSWAYDDLSQLEREMIEFFHGDAYEQFAEFNPETGEQTHKIKLVKPIPEGWRKLASHALADIRHSCDQSMFAACQALCLGTIEDDVYFPWSSHPNDLEAKMRRKDYIPEAIYPALRRCHPYPPGNGQPKGDDLIFEMRKLAGGNKHRVAIQPSAGVHHWGVDGAPRRLVIPREPWDSAKQEFTAAIFKVEPGEKIDMQVKLTFGISFGEVGPLKGEPVLGLLPYFARYAQFVCESLEREVTKILEGRGCPGDSCKRGGG